MAWLSDMMRCISRRLDTELREPPGGMCWGSWLSITGRSCWSSTMPGLHMHPGICKRESASSGTHSPHEALVKDSFGLQLDPASP